MKDVVVVPKWGSVKLLVPIMDYDGMTMFHCHIVEHEDIGMMGMWHIMPASMPMDLAIATSSLPDGQTGTAYAQTLIASGGMVPYTWSVSSGSLPDGLALDPAGSITGTPSKAGQYTFEIMVQDNMSAMAMHMFTITITSSLPPASPLSISTLSLAAGKVRTAYSQALTAIGGTIPYSWSITAGSLPSGIALNPSTGVIWGTPTIQGKYTFTVQVADQIGATASKSYILKINK